MNFGFLGLGSMGGAILRGMKTSGSFEGSRFFVYDPAPVNAQAEMCKSETELCEKADVVILCVKPQIIQSVAEKIAPVIGEKLIISIAAGKTLAFLKNCLGEKTHIVRVMPNINAVVLAATSAFCAGENVSDEEKETVKSAFETIGTVTELEEKQFAAFTAIASCSPAFSYMYIDALARAGVKAGLPRTLAQQIAASSVLGSAKMVSESEMHPIELCDKVCSPAGTTIEGVMALKSGGFEAAVHAAVQATIDRDRQL